MSPGPADEPRPDPAHALQRPRVFAARHGDTEWSAAGRHTGRTDIPLSESGRRQAAALAPLLAGRSFALTLASPLGRARETSNLAGFPDPLLDDDLMEWDYGDYDGLTTPEIQDTRPGWNLWRDGCPNGETIEAVAERADRVITRCRRTAGPVCLFAHGHLLRVLAARWIGGGPEVGANLMLGPAGLSVLDWERETPALGRWNLSPTEDL